MYKGGFERQMTAKEACLILNISQTASMQKIEQAHRKLMIANHPDRGGSDYIAIKVNEAKEMLAKNAAAEDDDWAIAQKVKQKVD